MWKGTMMWSPAYPDYLEAVISASNVNTHTTHLVNTTVTRLWCVDAVYKKVVLISSKHWSIAKKPLFLVPPATDVSLDAHCFKNTKSKPEPVMSKPICGTRRRCGMCHKLEVGHLNIKEHQCYHDECPSCKNYVDLCHHKSFIQWLKTPVEEREERRLEGKKRKRRNSKHKSCKRGPPCHEMDKENNEDKDKDEKKPPILVFFDIEAMQTHEQH